MSSQRMSTSLPMPDSPTVSTSKVKFSQFVKTLGVTLDAYLTMKNKVVNLVRTAKIKKLWPIKLVCSYTDTCLRPGLLHTRLLLTLSSIPSSTFQKVQNNATHLILKAPKSDHITPRLQTLHWLPVNARVQHKMCSLCFHAINSSGPQYLAGLLKIYVFSPTPLICWHSYTVHSFGSHQNLRPRCLFTHCTPSLE